MPDKQINPNLLKKVNMKPVESSNIDSIGYYQMEQVDRHLFIKFSNGNIYQYKYVDLELYKELMASESKGRFLHAKIKDCHAVIKLNLDALLKEGDFVFQFDPEIKKDG